jgi:hypothetical protein
MQVSGTELTPNPARGITTVSLMIPRDALRIVARRRARQEKPTVASGIGPRKLKKGAPNMEWYRPGGAIVAKQIRFWK